MTTQEFGIDKKRILKMCVKQRLQMKKQQLPKCMTPI